MIIPCEAASNSIASILATLRASYPEARCQLEYREPWQLLFATILSAQCTDDRVNLVTKDLYIKYASLEAFANADQRELEQDIRSCGFYHNKAANIIGCAKKLVEDYGGTIPSDIDLLTALPGVGRKTANVLRGNFYNIPSVVVDTHVKRVSARLGLTESSDPEKIEQDLMKVLPENSWIDFNHLAMAHGRKVCKAPVPKCETCPLRNQ